MGVSTTDCRGCLKEPRGHEWNSLLRRVQVSEKPVFSQEQQSRFSKCLVGIIFTICPHYTLVETDVQRAEMTPWKTLEDTIEGAHLGGVLKQWIKASSVEKERAPRFETHYRGTWKKNLDKES